MMSFCQTERVDIASNRRSLALSLLMKAPEKKVEPGGEKLRMLTVRMPQEVHRSIKIAAASADVSMQEWVIDACQRSLEPRILSGERSAAGKLAELAGASYDRKSAPKEVKSSRQ